MRRTPDRTPTTSKADPRATPSPATNPSDALLEGINTSEGAAAPPQTRPAPALAALITTVAILALAAPMLVGAAAREPLSAPLVVTQVPTRQLSAPAGWDARDLATFSAYEGAQLVLIAPTGQPVRVLSEGFDSACDPDVSFDGQRVLFAGRKSATDRWRIWEIGIDGQGLRAVSPETLEARSPIYVSTLFTLNSPEPWFTTVFVGRESTLNEVGRPSTSSLYNIKLDGGDLRRLTFNPNANLDPFQAWDGRVLYAAERHPVVPTAAPDAASGHIGLYAIHIEGADMELYGGELAQRIRRMPCATADGLVVFVESSEPSWDGAGQLACVEQRRPHVTYRALTRDARHLFAHPSPLAANQVLVARRDARGKGTWGIHRFDADTGTCEPLVDSPKFHEVQAVLAAPRRRPDGHSTVVDPNFDYGALYGLDCYTTDAAHAGHLMPGEVKTVRVIEGVTTAAVAGTGPSPVIPQRLVGEAPVEADGSFNLELPADTPLLLQTLDERGLALATCGWIWVKPRENRGCIGCHEDPELVPENNYVQALRRLPNRLVPPPEQRRVVTFRQDVAPILQKNCATAECHGGTRTPLALRLQAGEPSPEDLRATYATLLAMRTKAQTGSPAAPASGKYVDVGRARTSPLVWQLVGRNTTRPWDQAPAAASTALMPPAQHGAALSAEDLRTVILWIDMGAPFEAAPALATATANPPPPSP